ncbi:MAG: hypothetical protein ABID40_03090 [Candidatus Bipolaricaulota bacterium]
MVEKFVVGIGQAAIKKAAEPTLPESAAKAKAMAQAGVEGGIAAQRANEKVMLDWEKNKAEMAARGRAAGTPTSPAPPAQVQLAARTLFNLPAGDEANRKLVVGDMSTNQQGFLLNASKALLLVVAHTDKRIASFEVGPDGTVKVQFGGGAELSANQLQNLEMEANQIQATKGLVANYRDLLRTNPEAFSLGGEISVFLNRVISATADVLGIAAGTDLRTFANTIANKYETEGGPVADKLVEEFSADIGEAAGYSAMLSRIIAFSVAKELKGRFPAAEEVRDLLTLIGPRGFVTTQEYLGALRGIDEYLDMRADIYDTALDKAGATGKGAGDRQIRRQNTQIESFMNEVGR